jgi:RNA polymerase sigma factor (sigma-70 family)
LPKQHLHNLTDEELLSHYYIANNNDYVEALLNRYTLLLFGVCMKYLKNKTDANDAVQQVYLKILIELPKSKVTFFKSWLYIVAKNYCLSVLKNNKNTIYTETFDSQQPTQNDELLLENLINKDNNLTLMHQTLNELSPEQATCVKLFYLQKQSYALIENQTGFSYLQIKSFIQNGKRKLKILMLEKLRQL